MKGKITKVIKDKNFFFIDDEFWCHNDNYEKEPEVGDVVEYAQKILQNGRKNAENVKFIKKSYNLLPVDYEDEILMGYFNENGILKESLIIKYPRLLAELFSKDPKINKPTQVRKYYDYCKNLEGILKMKNDFNSILAELYQLIPLTNSALSKGNISSSFKDFLELNINQVVKSEKNFIDGFLPHFQSLIGYYKT
jgi:CRISPR/Cas system CSM-associated protein Csm2 small subunit